MGINGFGLTTKQAVQGVAGFGDTLMEGSDFLYTLYTIGNRLHSYLGDTSIFICFSSRDFLVEKLTKWLLIISGWSVGVLPVLVIILKRCLDSKSYSNNINSRLGGDNDS